MDYWSEEGECSSVATRGPDYSHCRGQVGQENPVGLLSETAYHGRV